MKWKTALFVTTAVLLVLTGCAGSPSPVRTVDDSVDTGITPIWKQDTVDVSLPEPFIRRVELSRLRVGMTRAEVLALFPDPEEIETTRSDTEFWGYNYAELLFRNGRLENWFYLPRGRMPGTRR
jgi:outer membrane protein assembly factor BamE (lipoprotein component of BamABCDE complex)